MVYMLIAVLFNVTAGMAIILGFALLDAEDAAEMLDRLQSGSISEALLLAAGGILLAILWEPFSRRAVPYLEGYFWPRLPARLGTRRQLRRYQRLVHRITVPKDRPHLLSSAHVAAALLQEFPSRDRVLPTRLGNIVRAAEDKIGDRYGASVPVVYPRLEAVIPIESRSRVEATSAQLDMFARMVMATLLLGVFAVIAAISNADLVRLALVAVAAMVAAFAFYQGAVGIAREWATDMEVIFDLYRLDLLRRLHLPVPSSWEESREAFTMLSRLLSGANLHGLQFFYPGVEGSNSSGGITIMGDQINVSGQALNVGREGKVQAERLELSQIKLETGGPIEMPQLASQLVQLRDALRAEPESDERDSAIGAIADAKRSADAGDEEGVLAHLSRAGAWVLKLAEKIGVDLAAAALKAAAGL